MTEFKEILFVDGSVEGSFTLLSGLSRRVEQVHINSDSDGLTQIELYVRGRKNIKAIHILSHGASGQLNLGGGRINLAVLDGHEATLASIRSALVKDADILLYGCNVAEGLAGQLFIRALSEATGANVAAASHPVGNSGLGGSWELDARLGDVRAGVVFSEFAAHEFTGLLPASPISINSISDDTGEAADFKTKDTTLTFVGSYDDTVGTVDSITVTLKLGAAVITTGTATLNTTNKTWSFTYPTILAAGNYTLTAVSLDSSHGFLAVDTQGIVVDTSTNVTIGSISSDTGSSSTDFITKTQTQSFTGSAEAGDTVVLTLDNSQIATVTADSSGVWTYNYTSTSLSVGDHTLKADATDLAGNTATTTQLIKIDTSAAGAISGLKDSSNAEGDSGTSHTDFITKLGVCRT